MEDAAAADAAAPPKKSHKVSVSIAVIVLVVLAIIAILVLHYGTHTISLMERKTTEDEQSTSGVPAAAHR